MHWTLSTTAILFFHLVVLAVILCVMLLLLQLQLQLNQNTEYEWHNQFMNLCSFI